MIEIPKNQFTEPFLESHKKLFHYILSTTATMDGWATPEKVCTLTALTLANKPQLITEIGVWAGRSLFPMALACVENNQGKVVGIDPYSASESSKDEFPDVADWWGKQDHEAIYKKFLYWNKFFKTELVVQLIRKKSDDVQPTSEIDILHIDGLHSEQALKDTERFAVKVKPGGFVILDDLHWIGGAVLRSMDRLEELGFKNVFELTDGKGNDWALFQRPK